VGPAVTAIRDVAADKNEVFYFTSWQPCRFCCHRNLSLTWHVLNFSLQEQEQEMSLSKLSDSDAQPGIVSEFNQNNKSTYSFLSAAELNKSNIRLMEAIEDGSVHQLMKRVAERTQEIGEVLIISARKMS
jgi:hypothetical protein